jgi:two-component system, sensor histidine kinase and response regulator
MHTLRVLVTDDEPGMRMGVERSLRDCRLWIPDVDDEVAFTVEQAETGEEAIERIRRAPPDILLLDHKMPGMSGLDVLERVADMKLDMLTVMITAYASIETAVLATKRGAYEFLAKPFTPDELKVTLQKTAARVLLAQRARRLDAEKRQVRFEFIRVLGHELKAPLNAVGGYLDLLRERALGDDLAAYDQPVARCAARIDGMRNLIHDLLDLTRIESGQKSRRLGDVDLRETARLALEGVAEAAKARGITLALTAGEPLVMRADAGELEMILNNLVSNAVKYNRDGGRVDVALARDGERVTLRVADTGIGMAPEALERVFEEFVRVRSSDTAHVEGSGLGLSIVRKLVQLYGGRVEVASEPGRGTTFTVTLVAGAPSPVTDAPAASG